MAKKKNKNNNNNEEQQQSNKNTTKNNKENNESAAVEKKTKNVTVVLKVDLHCQGCATKVVKCVRAFGGVEDVKRDGDDNKLTVIGDVDPVKLREKIEQKTHKKVELISPLPKKESKEKAADANKKTKDSNDNGKPKEEKKSKEPAVTTAVFKVPLHCDGCIQKIQRFVTKTPGYKDMKVDKQKDLVTVTGAMEMKALAESLKKHSKKNVEIVPPKKEGEKKEKKEGEKKEKGGGGGGGGDEKATANSSGGGGENKMQVQYAYPYPFMYGLEPGPWPGYGGGADQFQYYPYPHSRHAPQMFSDENPNACSVM